MGGHVTNKADDRHVYNIKKSHSSLFSLVSIERSLALGMWLAYDFPKLNISVCQLFFTWKWYFMKKQPVQLTAPAHKCFSLRQCSSFAPFSFSFQFYWDGSDIQHCVSLRPTARWLDLHILWNDCRGNVKGAPTSRNAVCTSHFTTRNTDVYSRVEIQHY